MHGTPEFDPHKAIEGDPLSPIWIVSLNPRVEPVRRTACGTNGMTWTTSYKGVKHFRRIKGVIGDAWYERLLEPSGIAHTDLVKCGSPNFDAVAAGAVEH